MTFMQITIINHEGNKSHDHAYITVIDKDNHSTTKEISVTCAKKCMLKAKRVYHVPTIMTVNAYCPMMSWKTVTVIDHTA